MRYIEKEEREPEPISDWKRRHGETEVNRSYETGFDRKADLLSFFLAEQFGLCAFTGVAIDERLGKNADLPDVPGMRAHVAHIKSQADCQRELIERFPNPPRPYGEDMNHHNMVAGLEINSDRDFQFGPSWQGENSLTPDAAWPTHPDCVDAINYLDNGEVQAPIDSPGKRTIDQMNLGHKILEEWRRGAINGWFDPTEPEHFTSDYLMAVSNRIMEPVDGKLSAFCFVVRSVALSRLLATADDQ